MLLNAHIQPVLRIGSEWRVLFPCCPGVGRVFFQDIDVQNDIAGIRTEDATIDIIGITSAAEITDEINSGQFIIKEFFYVDRQLRDCLPDVIAKVRRNGGGFRPVG
ncbi:hypothetical protein C7C56_019890 [Massilia glaciei]|uniref:Uncharacterized protein n=1 Tax=Massilia glaciei TaxID=1524097 RepID=A0A2U2HGI7_9BURK|nr:hypothetical protein C7C56_019890 [Massilia glaciei]